MTRKTRNLFFLRIVFPAILAILLFSVAVFVFIIPEVEHSIMERKREMLRELTQTAWSLANEYNKEHQNSTMTLQEAKEQAALRISEMRYGKQSKDYFWIINTHPTMIMHPYRGELNHQDLTRYEDPDGVKLFVEAVKIVQNDGAGYIYYQWQWKDDSTRIVPKLSYVKAYEPWGWIIGTGIYLDDVRLEMNEIKKRLLNISSLVLIIIAAILFLIVRAGLKIEKQKQEAESSLKLSLNKYKSLVSASTEGTLMVIRDKIIYSNIKFTNLSGYQPEKIATLSVDEMYAFSWQKLTSSFVEQNKSISLETKLKCSNGSTKDVVVSVSKVKYNKTDGYIIVTKKLMTAQIIERETVRINEELQSLLMLMNQPIGPFVRDVVTCPAEMPVWEAAQRMQKKERNEILVRINESIVGIVTKSDILIRVIADGKNPSVPVMKIMSSPVETISEDSLFFEAGIIFRNKGISQLAVCDNQNKIVGIIRDKDILGLQQNTVGFTIKELENCQTVEQLKRIRSRIPVLVNALIKSGDKTKNITRIVSMITDVVTQRIISFALEECGQAPCDFAFMVMGSEGRMEQTLSTDQDNAFIYNPPEPENQEKIKSYFLKLGKIISRYLNAVGYRYCDGNNMVTNPRWTVSLDEWKAHFNNWIRNSDHTSVLEAAIFFDFRCVYGKCELVDELRAHVNQIIRHKSVFLYNMAQSTLRFKSNLSQYSRMLSDSQDDEQKQMDIKRILHPVVSFVRLYSLKHALNKTNTIERLKKLLELSEISKSLFDETLQAYNYLMFIRLRIQAENSLQNKQVDNILYPGTLTHIEKATLKKILAEMENLQTKIKADFSGTGQM